LTTNNLKFKEIQKQLLLNKISITAIRISELRIVGTVEKHNFKAIIEALKEKIENSNDRNVSQTLGNFKFYAKFVFIYSYRYLYSPITQRYSNCASRLPGASRELSKGAALYN